MLMQTDEPIRIVGEVNRRCGRTIGTKRGDSEMCCHPNLCPTILKGVDPSEWKLGAIVLELEEILGVKAIICNHKMIGASLLFGNFLR